MLECDKAKLYEGPAHTVHSRSVARQDVLKPEDSSKGPDVLLSLPTTQYFQQ